MRLAALGCYPTSRMDETALYGHGIGAAALTRADNAARHYPQGEGPSKVGAARAQPALAVETLNRPKTVF